MESEEKIINERIFLKTLSKRMQLPEKKQRKLESLEKGHFGEEEVVDFIKEYGHPNWKIFRNIWLDEENPYETDILVIGNMGWLILEVKNYERTFRYEKGTCYYDNYPMSHDIVAQAKKIYLKNYFLNQKYNLAEKVQGALVFIGEHNVVDVIDEPDLIKVVGRDELKTYIQKAAIREERSFSQFPIAESVLKLQDLKIAFPYVLPIVDDKNYKQLQKGFYCPNCVNFNLKRTKKTFVCSCGNRISFKNALQYAIDEYAILFHNKNLKKQEVLKFLNYEVSPNALYRALKENFESVGKLKGTVYLNSYK